METREGGGVARCTRDRGRRGESGTTRWHPNKSKIGGTLYRRLLVLQRLKRCFARRKCQTRDTQIFRGFDSPRPSTPCPFRCSFPDLTKTRKEDCYSTCYCSRSYRVGQDRVVSPVNEVSTVNDIAWNRATNLRELQAKRGEINWFTPHQPTASSPPPPPPPLSTPSYPSLVGPVQLGERSSMKLFNQKLTSIKRTGITGAVGLIHGYRV